MAYVIGAALTFVVLAIWLQGSWIVPTIVSIVMGLAALLFVFKTPALSLICLVIAALFWIPFACWQSFGQQQNPTTPQTRRAIVGVETIRHG